MNATKKDGTPEIDSNGCAVLRGFVGVVGPSLNSQMPEAEAAALRAEMEAAAAMSTPELTRRRLSTLRALAVRTVAAMLRSEAARVPALAPELLATAARLSTDPNDAVSERADRELAALPNCAMAVWYVTTAFSEERSLHAQGRGAGLAFFLVTSLAVVRGGDASSLIRDCATALRWAGR